MEFAKQIYRFLYRKKWWLLLLPIFAIMFATSLTKDMPKVYSSNTVIYTGVVSGYNLETSLASRIDISQSNSQMENFINIIYSYTTLKNVSMKLFAQHIMYGDTINDNQYISANHFQPIWSNTPAHIRSLVDKSSEEITLSNLLEHDKSEYDNFLYGLFMWNYRYYGKENLEKIQVSRISNSDMIEIKYKCDDPNVVYHTLLLLNEEFLTQYQLIRDNEVNRAIEYFEGELDRVGQLLKIAENEQKEYSINKRIANYEEQTKQIAFIESSYKIKLQETQLAYNAAKVIRDEMEKKFGNTFDEIKNNTLFADKLKKVSSLSNELAISSIFDTNPSNFSSEDNTQTLSSPSTYAIQRELNSTEDELVSYIDDYYKYMGSGEVLISQDIALEWLKALIAYETAKEDLKVLKNIKEEIDQMFVDFSPIGVKLKQQERLINFLESEYSSAQDNLNQARLRKSNNLMSAASLKVITPPQLPLDAESSKRMYYIFGAGVGVFFFVLSILLIIELFGTTLKDSSRTERLTKIKVIAALPKQYHHLYAKYQNVFFQKAIRHLSNIILGKLRHSEINIINIISISPGVGKTKIISELSSYWNSIGRRHRIVNWKDALERNDREIMYPINYNDILALDNEKTILIEHRNLSTEIIQKDILQKALMNIIIVDGSSSWTDTDMTYLTNLKEQVGNYNNTLFACISNADKYAVEEFTGQLPPYNIFSNLSYSIYNLGKTPKSR